jgi:hypothetical protein
MLLSKAKAIDGFYAYVDKKPISELRLNRKESYQFLQLLGLWELSRYPQSLRVTRRVQIEEALRIDL